MVSLLLGFPFPMILQLESLPSESRDICADFFLATGCSGGEMVGEIWGGILRVSVGEVAATCASIVDWVLEHGRCKVETTDKYA